MAERRMFAKTIIDSDAFLELPITAQLLYFHLSMRADDDGFCNKPRAIMNMCGAKNDDIKALIENKFLIIFENGVVVIKHWRIHNYIRKDTYNETKYKFEKASLYLDENNCYSVHEQPALEAEPSRGRSVDDPSTQDRLGKDRVDKVSIAEDSVGESVRGGETPSPPASGSEEKIEELKKRIDQAKADNQFPVFISYKHILSQVYGIDYGGEWEGKCV